MSTNVQFDFTGKWVAVTGSTKGIGLAIAKAFAVANANIIVNGRSKSNVDETVAMLNQLKTINNEKPHVYGVEGDLSKLEEANTFCKNVEQLIHQGDVSKEKTLDVLVNNVGIFSVKPFEEVDDEEWNEYFNVNVMIAVRLCRYFLPKMIKQSNSDPTYFGRIVNISSECGLRPIPYMIPYSVSRTAILGLSRGLAELTKGTRVTVNSVLPGPTLTEGVDNYFDTLTVEEKKKDDTITKESVINNYFKEKETTSLIQRFLHVDEIAHATLFLSSINASAINGSSQRVEGGIYRSI